MVDKSFNPAGTDGFAFIEFCAPDPKQLADDFKNMGFERVAKHVSKACTLYSQGDIFFIINNEPNSHALQFAKKHGPSVCGMAFRVQDGNLALKHSVANGAKPYATETANIAYPIPAIYGIGGSLIYFIDAAEEAEFYRDEFDYQKKTIPGAGLTYIDHLTHNVQRGEMDTWAGFYERIFNFREIRYFDIQGKMTGLISRAMTSPCGKIRIPINEATDDKSQIQEFITDFKGEGIQHIALGANDIYRSVKQMRTQGIKFLTTPDTYFEGIQDRVPWHQEDLNLLKNEMILLDGSKTPAGGLLLQIFTENMLGPSFFEIIQRKGNEGFGEGNFQALFEAIERDQIKRGVLSDRDS